MRIIINENDYINEIPEFAKYDKNLEMGLNLINWEYCNKCGKKLKKVNDINELFKDMKKIIIM